MVTSLLGKIRGLNLKEMKYQAVPSPQIVLSGWNQVLLQLLVIGMAMLAFGVLIMTREDLFYATSCQSECTLAPSPLFVWLVIDWTLF
jgi:hypothetical protein